MFLGGGHGDYRRAADAAETWLPEGAGTAISNAVEEARALVRDHRDALDRLADALHQRGHLDWDEARGIAAAA